MNPSKKISYTAVFTAISIIAVVGAYFLPLSVFPFMLATLCLLITLNKCGFMWGFLLALICCSVSAAMFPTGFVYIFFAAPHGFVCWLLSKIKLKNPFIKYPLKYLILIVFFSAALVGIYFLADAVLFSTALPVMADIVGGYALFTLVATVIFIAYHELFMAGYREIMKLKVLR